MATQSLWIAGHGMIEFDDADTYVPSGEDQDYSTDTDTLHALKTTHQMLVQTAPSNTQHVLRKYELDTMTGVDKVEGSAAGINAKTLATTNLSAALAQYVLTGLIIRATAVSAITGFPKCKLKNVTQGIDVTEIYTLGGVSVARPYIIPITFKSNLVAGGDILGFEITTAAVGTTLTLQVYAKGVRV